MYIADVVFFSADNDRYYHVNSERMRLTRDGIELIESKFGIAKELTAEEKLKFVIKKCGVFGLQALKMFGAEIIRQISG